MYSILDNYLLARLISDLAMECSNDPAVSVDAEFPEDLRKSKQVVVSLRSDSHVQTMPSNLYGVLHSLVSLAEYPSQEYPSSSIIWANEVQEADSIVQAGFYFTEVTANEDNTAANLTITPLFYDKVNIEYKETYNPFEMPESFKQATPASIRVSENSYVDNPRFLILGTHYDVDQIAGNITIHWGASYEGAPFEVEWYYWGDAIGPVEIEPGRIYDNILPGVRLFFGHDIFHAPDTPDKQIVAVESKRIPIADVFAGRWRVSMSVMVYTQSKIDLGRLVDKIKQAIAVKFYALYGDEGMVIMDVTSSRSSEVQYDTPEEYSFQGEVTFDISVPWFQASTYLIPLLSMSIISPAPDSMSDLEAAEAESQRFVYRTRFDTLLDTSDIERVL